MTKIRLDHGQYQGYAGLLARYGTVAGFGRSVGEVSVDLAAIPVSASYAAARTQVAHHLLIAFGLLMVIGAWRGGKNNQKKG